MTNKARVLVVDDSPVSRMMLKAIISNNFPDFDICEAPSGVKAAELAKESPFDVITLDMNMPEVDGLTIAPKLKASCPHAHIVLLTSSLKDEVRQEALDQGLQFLAKPIRNY